MKKTILTVALLLGGIVLSPYEEARADNSFNSEASHVVGTALIAGAVTAVANEFSPENRFLIGFGTTVAGGILYEVAVDKRISLLDVGADILGAAIGAYVTDGYILRPVVQHDTGTNETKVGLFSRMRF